MDFSINEYDTIESLIFENDLKIKGVHFYQDMGFMLVVLSNQRVIRYVLSDSERLKNASKKQLKNYELIGKGAGIHWPELDEDLSLKGFLKSELASQVSALVV